nr:hypothetical protein [uncultured Treponema sp.]
MKRVIALYASANKGKTTTLNRLIDLLSLISDYYEKCRSDEGWAYFEIRGLKVVVCTPGDSKVEVKENIKFSQKYDCDIFVTATRTKGETTREMERFTNKKDVNLVWIKKDTDEQVNNLFAANIFNLIIKEIDYDFSSYVFDTK